MDIKQIKQYLKLMETNGLVEFELEDNDQKIKLVKSHAPVVSTSMMPGVVAAAPAAGSTDAPAAAEATTSADLKPIASPMVGTFYSAPSPGAAPFVKVGDRVEKDTVICIVEAMKVMNEIKAECDGVIREALLESGEPVEYDQAMFLVDPS